MLIEFRATSKLDSRYARYLGDIENSPFLRYMKNIGKVIESSFLFTYFDVVIDDSHECIINVTQEQIKNLDKCLEKEINKRDRSAFHNIPDEPKFRFSNSLCYYNHNSRFLEYGCNYWECLRLLYKLTKDINKGVVFDWNKDTLEIIFSW